VVAEPNQSPKMERKCAMTVERLVADGASRLTAERIVAIERGLERVGRARRHTAGRS